MVIILSLYKYMQNVIYINIEINFVSLNGIQFFIFDFDKIINIKYINTY